jgi:N-methylhydantoinase A
MADQIRLMTIKRGHDPRHFALVVLGGAGPVHGVALAEEMGMAEVLVPEAPGVLAAFGLLAAPVEHHHARTLTSALDTVDLEAANACLTALDEAGRARMTEEGVSLESVRVHYAADMRYVGQAYELEIPLRVPLTREQVQAARADFHVLHERVYGYARAGQPVEFVNFRAVHTLVLPPPLLRAPEGASHDISAARVGERSAYFVPSGFLATPIFDRARLPLGVRLAGPAIIEQPDTTTVIPPGYAATLEESGNLRIRRLS